MELYLDLFFIVNFIMNFILLEIVNYTFNYSNSKIFVSSFLLTLLTTLKVFSSIPFFVTLVSLFLLLFIIYYKKNKKQFLNLVFIYIVLTLIYGGVYNSFELNIYLKMIVVTLIISFIWVYLDYYILDSNHKNYLLIDVNGKQLDAFVDSGNLMKVDGRSVCFLKTKYYCDKFEFVKSIKIETVTGKQDIDLFLGDLKINGIETCVYFSFNDHILTDALINNNLVKFRRDYVFKKNS